MSFTSAITEANESIKLKIDSNGVEYQRKLIQRGVPGKMGDNIFSIHCVTSVISLRKSKKLLNHLLNFVSVSKSKSNKV